MKELVYKLPKEVKEKIDRSKHMYFINKEKDVGRSKYGIKKSDEPSTKETVYKLPNDVKENMDRSKFFYFIDKECDIYRSKIGKEKGMTHKEKNTKYKKLQTPSYIRRNTQA